MLPENRTPIPPGEILLEVILKPLGISESAPAEHIGLPEQQIAEIVQGRRGITPQLAWLLGQSFGTSPEFRVHLQTSYDLATHRPEGPKEPLQSVNQAKRWPRRSREQRMKSKSGKDWRLFCDFGATFLIGTGVGWFALQAFGDWAAAAAWIMMALGATGKLALSSFASRSSFPE